MLMCQNFRVLHNFGHSLGKYGTDGDFPAANLIEVNGALYGTTLYGGNPKGIGCDPSCGAVFSISTTTDKARVLYSFGGQSDSHWPKAGLTNVRGTLYGTTLNGGEYDFGTVFSLTTTGTETVSYSFHGKPDGAVPYAGLINVNGTLYGTTYQGGAYNGGTVFRISRGKEAVLHSFSKGSDGAFPYASLIDVNGLLYGTTYFGGAHKAGTVFRISTSGTEQVLYSFRNKGADGYNPAAGLVELGGILYGTTLNGGAYQNGSANGGGTVFSITTTGVETVLHSFSSNPDGASPVAGLIAVKGTLYGTTELGGVHVNGGTVFSITTTGVETVLHSFAPNSGPPTEHGGTNPVASLIDLNGTLYGTAYADGKYRGGTVFALTP